MLDLLNLRASLGKPSHLLVYTVMRWVVDLLAHVGDKWSRIYKLADFIAA